MGRRIRPKAPDVPAEAGETLRQRLEVLLRGSEHSFEGLRRILFLGAKDLEHELAHLDRTLKARGEHLSVRPGECLGCGFVFQPRGARPFHAPGRCPACKSERVESPSFRIG